MGKFSSILCFSCALQLTFGEYNKILSYRPIQTGDLLTPADFLIIAKKLMEKEGKGIVSSARNPQQLADKFFQRYFFTNTRFAPVRVLDITTLDAIQALALSGDDFQPSIHFVPLKSDNFVRGFPQRCRYALANRKAENIKKVKGAPKKAQTEIKKTVKNKKLLKTSQIRRKAFTNQNIEKSGEKLSRNIVATRKTVRNKRKVVSNPSTIRVTRTHIQSDGRKRNDVSQMHHVIPQAKKLMKNRVMVVKSDRKKRDTIVKEDVNITKFKHGRYGREQDLSYTSPYHKMQTNQYSFKVYDVEDFENSHHMNYNFQLYSNNIPPLEIDKEKCYWQYQCKSVDAPPFELCGLHPECEGTESDHFIRDDIPTKHKFDEHDKRLIQFRREVGVGLIDEEVEKIIERRYCQLMVSKGNKDPRVESPLNKKHKENLKSYFQNIIYAQKQHTTAMPPPLKQKKKVPYKYLRKENPYSDPEVQQKIKEFQQQKAIQVKLLAQKKMNTKSRAAVISLTTPITTPLPQFMHVI